MHIINDFSRFVNIKQKMGLSRLCIAIVVLLSSFDIVLTFDIGGYTFRSAQIFLGIGILIYCVRIIINKELILPKVIIPLFIWVILQGVLICNSPNINNAIGYYLWLITDLFIIFLMYQLIQTKNQVIDFLKLYLDSFYILAIIGIIQFVLGILGIDFYIYSWFGKMPRIRGFSFESSYYSTYLIIGWTILAYFAEMGTNVFGKRRIYLMLFVVTSALILSTSRMGYLFMAIWVALRVIINSIGIGIERNKKMIARIMLVVMMVAIIIIIYMIFKTTMLDSYLEGLGIKGLSSHSANDRINGAKRLLLIFLQSPFKGYSIGGTDPIIAQTYGLKFETGLGFCVWIEMLVASGIIGFCILMTGIIVPIIKVLTGNKGEYFEKESKAIVWAFLMEAGILSFNQNILRIYFWIIFGMIFVLSKARRGL